MARWRLNAPHYLNVPGTKWEYHEVDRKTGRPKRVQFDVPTHLDPDNPSDWTHVHGRDQGEIVVSDGKGETDPRDLIFRGEPTPDMVPLDAEAIAISKSFESRWQHPIESLPGTYSEHLLDKFQAEAAAAQAAASKPAQIEGLSDLLVALTAITKQNSEILASLAGPRRL